MGKARRDGRWINILLALLLLAGAVMTVHEGVAALQTSAALARGAVETRGVVLEKRRSAAGDTSDIFSIRYGYEAGGESYEGTARIASEDASRALRVGDAIDVYCAASAPQSSAAFALPGGRAALRCALSFVPAAALLALAGTGGAQALKRRRAQKRSNTHP